MVEIREIPLEGKGLRVGNGQKECPPTLPSGATMPATHAAVGHPVPSKQGEFKCSTQSNVFTY